MPGVIWRNVAMPSEVRITKAVFLLKGCASWEVKPRPLTFSQNRTIKPSSLGELSFDLMSFVVCVNQIKQLAECWTSKPDFTKPKANRGGVRASSLVLAIIPGTERATNILLNTLAADTSLNQNGERKRQCVTWKCRDSNPGHFSDDEL